MIVATKNYQRLNKNNKKRLVLELEIEVLSWQRKIMDKRFFIASKLYNALIREFDKRLRLMKESKAYRKTCKMEQGRERNESFKYLREKYGFTQNLMEKYVTEMTKHFTFQRLDNAKYNTPKTHINSQIAQKLALRAMGALEKKMYGEGKKVRFHNVDSLGSIEGKSNKTGIVYDDTTLKWTQLEFKVKMPKEKDIYAQEMLMNRICFVRIVRKEIRGKVRYFAQLVLEGLPPAKYDSAGELM